MRDIALSNMENELKELQLNTLKKTIFEIKEKLYEKDRLFRKIVESKEAFNILSNAQGDKFYKLLTIRRNLLNKNHELWNIICTIDETTVTIENNIKQDKL